ncbi:kinesin-related protein 4-like, partial [Trifolium pratense]
SKGRNGHIPFRDSKLTRILQSSLGGNARTAIICTMSPARSHAEQTRNTLLFASCAKEVETNAQVNVVVSDKALVKQLQKQLAKLESELRYSGSSRPNISDSSELLREKDQEIEMLKKEVRELTLQRDLAQIQIKDMLQEAGDNVSCLIGVESLVGPRYPKLRVRNTWNFENQRQEPEPEPEPEPNVLSIDCEESVRSFDASQYSDGHSISSDDNLFQLPDLEKNLMVRNSSPRLSVTSINNALQNDLDQKNIEDQNEEDYCKEVRCIEIEEPITNTHAHTNSEDLRSNTYTDSSASSPHQAKTDMSGLIVVDAENKNDTDLCSSGLKEDHRLINMREYFAFPTPENSTPWMIESNRSSSSCRSLKLSRSRSCKAGLMRNLSSDWFEDDDVIQNTPPIGNEKDFSGRPEGFPRKVHTLHYNANAERNSMENPASDDVQIVKSFIDKESESNGPLTPKTKETENLKRLNLLDDHEVHGTGLEVIMSGKNVKDIGLDPMQTDGESDSDWPSKFNRLQKEIVELWDACNISLVHRTYFFLLFKGDPLDSIYMEVEHRRLSYLKQTFLQGNKTLEDGRTLTPETR